MGFKLPGKSMHSGTSEHASALKMAESALKQKVYIKPGGSMKHKMKDLPMNSKERYEEYQRRGWGLDATVSDYAKSLENKPEETKVDVNKEAEIDTTPKGTELTEKQNKKLTKLDKKKEKHQAKNLKKVQKVQKYISEGYEDESKKQAKFKKKEAKIKHGKKSKEYLQAKKAHLQAKEADRQGAAGGKKQALFKGVSSWINKKRQAKIDKKLAKLEEESPATMKSPNKIYDKSGKRRKNYKY